MGIDGPSFSICIPNYNYAHYLPQTIESVLAQTYDNYEILLADNASTDASVDVAKKFGADRIRIIQNNYNIGFAPNLDRATFDAKNDHLIVLSSDDLMRPTALETYAKILTELGPRAKQAVLTSAIDVIDADSKLVGVSHRPDGGLFYKRISATDAEAIDWASLTRVDTRGELALREALLAKDVPAVFLATCYPRAMYESVEGYNSGYRMWPDTHFLNKLMSQPDTDLIYVPQRLFAYRVHNNNQMANEARSKALKYQVDAYLHTLEFPDDVLDRIGLSREQLVSIFVEKSLMERGLQAMASKNWERGLKCLAFGLATYPKKTVTEPKSYALAGLLALGPAGGWVAERLYKRHTAKKARPA